VNAPRRWLEDPEADESLREVLRATPRARPLDPVTRRRLRAQVARASALPAVAASWLFVKSAGAALGVVLGAGAIAVATGVVEWTPRRAPSAVTAPHAAPRAPASRVEALAPREDVVEAAPEVPQPEISPSEVVAPLKLNPAPPLPHVSAAPSASGPRGLSAEAALLEQARRDMRAAPAIALSVAAEHAQRFPQGQLTSERTLIQIEALHRLNRDMEARGLARGLLGGTGSGLYAERVHQLLGENLEP
jgi:hypothetical protein